MPELALFFAELKRRRVFRAAGIYAVVAWALIQVAATVQPFLRMPAWTVTLVIVLLAIGLPVALVLAWLFDLTPDGLQRAVARDAGARSHSARVAGWTVVAMSMVLGGWLAYSRSSLGLDDKSIAVLPFANLSTDQANEYFAAGVHEQILNELNRIEDLKVISRTSVLQYKDPTRDLREIGRALGVATILEGSVQRDGQRVRIHAQLIDAKREGHLWSETYDRNANDIFAIQSDIAQQIARALQARLTNEQKAELTKPPTTNLAAYDIYLRAQHQSRATIANLYEAVKLFRQAIALDSTFASAYVGLAYRLLDLADRHFEWHLLPEAEATVVRAVALAPRSAETLMLVARDRARRGDHDGAFAQAALAREIQPSDATTLAFIANQLVNRGLYAEAIRLLDRVIELDPANPGPHVTMSRALVDLQRWSQAIAHVDRAISLSTGDPQSFVRKFRLRLATAQRLEELQPVVDDGIRMYGHELLAQFLIRGSGDLAPIMLELRPDFFDHLAIVTGVDSVDALLVRGYALERKGRKAEARAEFEADRRIGEGRIAALTSGLDPRFRQASFAAVVHSDLALAYAALGRGDEAVAAARAGVNALPSSSNDPAALDVLWVLARVYIAANQLDSATTTIDELLTVPGAKYRGLTANRLRLDPIFAPLRGRSAFDRLTQ